MQQKLISSEHIRTREQLEDIFTKALNGVWIDYIYNKCLGNDKYLCSNLIESVDIKFKYVVYSFLC